jgi:carbon storage regulator
MLVLSRKPGEKILIDNSITVTILSAEGGRVRIGVEAPDDVRILRNELAFWSEPASERVHPDLTITPDAVLPPGT